MSLRSSPPSSAPIDVPGWAVITIGRTRLAIPQREVHRIDLAVDIMQADRGEEPEIGWLRVDDGSSWPVYSLDEGLQLERSVSAERRLCVFTGTEGSILGILCDHAQSLDSNDDLAVQPVPGCMSGLSSVAEGLAGFEDSVALVTNSAALGDYVMRELDRTHGTGAQ